MKLIKPTVFTPAALISSNAVETYAAYSAATTYAQFARVDYGTSIYESLVNSNLNHTPDVSPTWWLKVGPDNRHSMFDEQISTVTTATSPLTVTVATGFIDSLFLGNISGTSVSVVIRDGLAGPIVYQETRGLTGDVATDWYQYFFYDPYTKVTQVLFQNIPPFANSHTTITITGGAEPVKIGTFVYGVTKDLGLTQYGVSAGIVDFSKKETDEFGNTIFVRRGFSKRLNAQVTIDNNQLNRVSQTLYDLRAIPVVWVASDDPYLSEPLIVFGFYRDFSTEISYPTFSLCNLEIEGLI